MYLQGNPFFMELVYKTVSHPLQLRRILELQQLNLPNNISPQEKFKEGFVTVEHDYNLLQKMNSPFPHIIAVDNDIIIAYALVMLKELRKEIKVLKPMFNQIDKVLLKSGKSIRYFVMGQVCIDKAYRSKGIFYGLYNKMKEEMSENFEAIITEVDPENPRSLYAHLKQGFKILDSYKDEHGRPWELIIWDWS